jgi:hypothetical protein
MENICAIQNATQYLKSKYENSFKIDRLMNIHIFSLRIASFIELVNFWSQILGYVVYACDNHKIRKKIINNLNDENCGNLTHVETFYEFLVECGFNKPLDEIKTNHVIKKYYDMLNLYICDNTFEQSCAILGSIEYVYHMMSGEINKYFEEKMNYQPSNHYTTHESLDVKHATDLFECSTSDCLNSKFLDIGANWIINCMEELIDFKPVFGYTYEDSDIEKYALSLFENKPENGLIILSGGDTLFELAGKITNLTAVDMNLGQVKLVKNKIYHIINKSYDTFLMDLEKQEIVYDKLFCKIKKGDSFENVFNIESLKKDFGEEAVKNTTKDFATHFNEVSNNHGVYHGWIFDRNLQIKIDKSKEFDIDAIQKTNIEHSLFEDKLTFDTYDFIQTSNITDWMDNKSFLAFCDKVKTSLRIGGMLVMRRLASNNILHDKFPNCIVIEDKTDMYSETIIWKKIKV